jgi:hypothetical protein
MSREREALKEIRSIAEKNSEGGLLVNKEKILKYIRERCRVGLGERKRMPRLRSLGDQVVGASYLTADIMRLMANASYPIVRPAEKEVPNGR